MEDQTYSLLQYINGLSPFFQALWAAAVFAIGVVILRFLLGWLQRGGKFWFIAYSHVSVLKHIIYRDYVSSDLLSRSTWGNLFVVKQALKSLIGAIGILVFFGGVSAILSSEWFKFAFFFFAFNLLFDANSWLKDWSSEKDISGVSDDVKRKLLAEFPAAQEQKSNDSQKG